ncbi:MAG: AEC family transporter [Deltaproteobacteria bacterium]|nr:AEC family transporter [Deltaproteobacteria bacterium]
MDIVATIIPIFAVIILGWFASVRGFIPQEFLGPANRLVYYIAIPAMIFRSISRSSFTRQFDIKVLLITLLSILVIFGFAWCVGVITRIRREQRSAFVQDSFHGNLGYIGLAVAYYFLGTEGLARASIIAGFMMILQNLLGVTVLALYSSDESMKEGKWNIALRIMRNPIILSVIAGMLFSIVEIPIPLIINRSLDILSGLALPMALLIIGGSLSFKLMRLNMLLVLSTGMIKLVLLPGLGFLLFSLSGIVPADYLPGLILLASPTATVTYVMAKEMNGDTDFAVAAISTSTLMSAVTFTVWLNFAR